MEVSELSDVQEKINEGAFALKTLSVDEVRYELQKAILTKNGFNSFANIEKFAPISNQTVLSYIREMAGIIIKGKVHPQKRIEPFNKILVDEDK